MAKARNDGICDFDNTDTGNTDELSVMRDAQQKLYTLDNPYVGSKRSIIVDIATALNKNGVKFDSVFDVFSGSGVVSLFFKLMGKNVIANDLLVSSINNARAFVENNQFTLSLIDIDYLCHNNNPSKTAFVRERFGNKRFTLEESAFLDNYRANVQSLCDKIPLDMEKAYGDLPHPLSIRKIIKAKEALALTAITHYILNRCFLGGRLNKGQVLADLKHRIDHQRNDGSTMQFQIDPPLSFFVDGVECMALHSDALAALEQVQIHQPDVQLAYLDPPYGAEQSDYAQMYSFAEEYACQKPLDQLDHIKNAKRFTNSKQYEMHFRELLNKSAWIPQWAISYNDSSWADVDKLKSIVSEFKKDVITENITHTYKYRKNRKSATEYLIIGR